MLHFESLTGNTCHFIICGDMNARIGTCCDYVDNDSMQISDILPDDYIINAPLIKSV